MPACRSWLSLPSLISAYPLLGAHLLTTYTYKRMCLLTRVYSVAFIIIVTISVSCTNLSSVQVQTSSWARKRGRWLTVTLPTMDHWWSSFWCMLRGGSASESARHDPSLPSFVFLTALCSDCSRIEHHIPTFTMLITRCVYRRCACVGVIRIFYSKVYDFPHTHRHFVGQ